MKTGTLLKALVLIIGLCGCVPFFEQVDDISANVEIRGVREGEVYTDFVNITWTAIGEVSVAAVIDDEPYRRGSAYAEEGMHTFTAFIEKNNQTAKAEIHFAIFKSMGLDIPLVMVETSGRLIVDDPKVPAVMRIYERNDETSRTLDILYAGNIEIELRGKTSQAFRKKQYAFRTEDSNGRRTNVSLLGMPAESDWILYGPYIDTTLMKNYLAYTLSRNIGVAVGRYAPGCEFVELYLNTDGRALNQGHYHGVYLIMEKIKQGPSRVDISPLAPESTTEPEITGGYILKIDKLDWSDRIIENDWVERMTYTYPRSEAVSEIQHSWVESHITEFGDVLNGPDFADPDPDIGWTKYIDHDSFVDYFIINELAKNNDFFFASTYMYKNPGDKIHMGPVWDFDISMGVLWSGESTPEGWFLCDGHFANWPNRLFQDPNFKDAFKDRWDDLQTTNKLTRDAVIALIDQTVSLLSKAQKRNFQRWPAAENFENEIDKLKAWFEVRIQWINDNIESL